MHHTARHRRPSSTLGPRAATVSGAAALLTIGLAGTAAAEPLPRPTAADVAPSPAPAPSADPSALPAPAPSTQTPVVPSQEEIDAARAALAAQEAEAEAAQASYHRAADAVDRARAAAELAAEQYNGAQVRLSAATKAYQAADGRARAAEATLAAAQVNLGRVAAQTYESRDSVSDLAAVLDPSGPQSVIDQSAGLETLGEVHAAAVRKATADAAVARELRSAAQRANDRRKADEATARAARDKAAAAEAASLRTAETMRAAQDAALAKLAELNRTSVALERTRAEGMRLEAEQKAALEREIAARVAAGERVAEARAESAGAASRSGYATGTVSAPSPQAQRAIDFAMAQIGDWYLWGGSGPDRWDCSGLTQGAWAQAGVPLDHYTGSQWAQTDRVPLSELQPGDLVFFGSSPSTIHHVGMYLGGGKMVNAPHTGAQVRVESMYWADLLPYGGRVRS